MEPPYFHITFKGERFACSITSAEIELRCHFANATPAQLDVTVAAQSVIVTRDDGSTFTYNKPNLYLDTFDLPLGVPSGDIRTLERAFAFHQSRDERGKLIYEHDAPGALYFNHHQQIDDLVLDLRHLGHARFHLRAEGSVEMDTTFRLETPAIFSGISCSLSEPQVAALGLNAFDDAAFEDARARNISELPVAAIPDRLRFDFARRFSSDQFDLALRQNVNHKGWTLFAVPRSSALAEF